MSSEGGLEDFSLMELFRSEVETHSEVLSAALLALERSPADTSRVGEMMRAAHSIKGAARVVGVDPAVNVAHAMEDCFVAAQRGELTLTPSDVDVLLRGVDLLGKLSEATKDPRADLAAGFDESVHTLVLECEALLHGQSLAGGGSAESAVIPTSAPAPAAAPAPARPAATATPAAATATTLAFPELLDGAAAEEVRRKYLAAVEAGYDSVRIDLRATRDLDVQGLVLLAAIPRHAAANGRPALRLAGVSAEMEAVLGVTGLAGAFGATREGA